MTEESGTTLILGIDRDLTVVQCGPGGPAVLGRPAEELLGVSLTDLVAGESLSGLVDAVRTGVERTAMLTVKNGGEAVVSVQPVSAAGEQVTALVLIRVALSPGARFLDPRHMRRMMFDEGLARIGALLDLDQLAHELVDVVVPHYCSAAGLLLLESLVAADETSGRGADGVAVLRRLAVASTENEQAFFSTFPTGEVLVYPPDTPYTRVMATGQPVLEYMSPAAADALAKAWRRRPVAALLGGTSLALLPLITSGVTLGFVACVRFPGARRFDAYDVEIGMEFANRAAVFIDNARLYNRERATGLALQRSLLPTGLPTLSTVDVRHRYLPASRLVEVGGDWYDTIVLSGGRLAMVVGDVAGHGVRAAVTMGRLRTAVHTLANLELSPGETLQQLDVLMRTLGEREPHFATCAYAVYDTVTGICEIASAGHLPPLLAKPGQPAVVLDLPAAPPLGVGVGPIESRSFAIEDGSLIVLYTDGLVENRTQDIDDGMRRLSEVFNADAPDLTLEDLCKNALSGVYTEQHRDDIALLVARLSRLPDDHKMTLELSPEAASVRRGRDEAADTLERWGLGALAPVVQLIVSELVTNAIRYGSGPITLRLLHGSVLVCEVFDSSGELPVPRNAGDDDEHGRGLQIVRRLSQRWGSRRTDTGKSVWCELPVG